MGAGTTVIFPYELARFNITQRKLPKLGYIIKVTRPYTAGHFVNSYIQFWGEPLDLALLHHGGIA